MAEQKRGSWWAIKDGEKKAFANKEDAEKWEKGSPVPMGAVKKEESEDE